MRYYRVCPSMEFANRYKEALSVIYNNVDIVVGYFGTIYVIYG